MESASERKHKNPDTVEPELTAHCRTEQDVMKLLQDSLLQEGDELYEESLAMVTGGMTGPRFPLWRRRTGIYASAKRTARRSAYPGFLRPWKFAGNPPPLSREPPIRLSSRSPNFSALS